MPLEHKIPVQLGQRISWKGSIWKVIGDDTISDPHPNPANKKWDYLLKDESSERYEKVIAAELIGEIQVLPDEKS